ncbi:MAG: helix-turn-helix domain-containing protein [Betaproteobacteria bacterium]|nr:helix-turn-helix domain-containing protein [Betaproteobacteria bacterium]
MNAPFDPGRAPVDLRAAEKVSCLRCCLRELCAPHPGEFSPADKAFLRSLVKEQNIRLRRGQNLFHAGDPFRNLYAVHTGAFKSVLIGSDGRELVSGFSFAGDMLGLDSIGDRRHPSHAVALDDGGVCVLPYSHVEKTAARVALVQRQLSRMLARELRQHQEFAVALGIRSAQERLATFLFNLSRRFAGRGFSSTRLRLPMSRTDIASHLALTAETVSRTFTQLEREGVIRVSAKTVEIVDSAGLSERANLAPVPLQASRA